METNKNENHGEEEKNNLMDYFLARYKSFSDYKNIFITYNLITKQAKKLLTLVIMT